jgi:hypothetical protein
LAGVKQVLKVLARNEVVKSLTPLEEREPFLQDEEEEEGNETAE